MAVSGFIGHEDEWEEFEKRWPAVLKEFGITEFHMTEFAQSSGEFKKWRGSENEPTRRAFIDALTRVINQHTRQPVGAVVDMHAYRWFNQRFHIKEVLGTPYGIAAHMAWAAALDWKLRNDVKEQMLFLFEKGDNEQGDYRKNLGTMKWDEPALTVEPSFCKKRWTDETGATRYCYLFQASDFAAYEHAKSVIDVIRYGKSQARMSLRKLSPPNVDRRLRRILNRHVLWNFVRNVRIAPRAGYRFEDYWVADGPLCFVGLDVPLQGTDRGVFHN